MRVFVTLVLVSVVAWRNRASALEMHSLTHCFCCFSSQIGRQRQPAAALEIICAEFYLTGLRSGSSRKRSKNPDTTSSYLQLCHMIFECGSPAWRNRLHIKESIHACNEEDVFCHNLDRICSC